MFGTWLLKVRLFLLQALKNYITFEFRFIGQHIGYRHSKINNYRLAVSVHIGASLIHIIIVHTFVKCVFCSSCSCDVLACLTVEEALRVCV